MEVTKLVAVEDLEKIEGMFLAFASSAKTVPYRNGFKQYTLLVGECRLMWGWSKWPNDTREGETNKELHLDLASVKGGESPTTVLNLDYSISIDGFGPWGYECHGDLSLLPSTVIGVIRDIGLTEDGWDELTNEEAHSIMEAIAEETARATQTT